MGLIDRIFGVLFGGGNVIRDTAEVFRVNAEASDQRDMALRAAALSQFGAEFALPRKGIFDRLIDGLNRIPRPAMAIGTLGLFGAAMVDPVWFAARMQGITVVPEPLWWLLGAIVSFYFGARHQAKGHEFQQSLALSMARAGDVQRQIRALEGGYDDPETTDPNPALDAWKREAAR